MIHGVLIVNSCGGLIYDEIIPSAFSGDLNIDRVIAMASTIYTAMEILSSHGITQRAGKYTKMYLRYEKASLTAMKTQTGMIFVIIHDTADTAASILKYVENAHVSFVSSILHNPEYYVDDRISIKFLHLENARRN
ncbi:hypothetical protein NEIG_02157 [Nematocida sp. ERTm5]|nr:trafficking protein particle complex subunit 4 [Nematocida sp. AWRm79]KAI5185345.1 trafficking protein particle complex subunit 4 [Nematocida sp. AWRm78]OAG32692.1 hypothetical protein NEIG_02157 [Nematocida sp. ERTm5]